MVLSSAFLKMKRTHPPQRLPHKFTDKHAPPQIGAANNFDGGQQSDIRFLHFNMYFGTYQFCRFELIINRIAVFC